MFNKNKLLCGIILAIPAFHSLAQYVPNTDITRIGNEYNAITGRLDYSSGEVISSLNEDMVDIIALGSGINQKSLSFSLGSRFNAGAHIHHEYIITLLDESGSPTSNTFTTYNNRFKIIFNDGVQKDLSTILLENNVINGTLGVDVFENTDGYKSLPRDPNGRIFSESIGGTYYGKGGNDEYRYLTGKNRIHFERGDGQDTIFPEYKSKIEVIFNSDISKEQVNIEEFDENYFILNILNNNGVKTEDSIKIKKTKSSKSIGFDFDDILFLFHDSPSLSLKELVLRDVIRSSTQGNYSDNTLRGTRFNNALFGAEGNDNLVGLSGNDFLIGGQGDDRLYGGLDKDVYVYGKGDGSDRIQDNVQTENHLNLREGVSVEDVLVYKLENNDAVIHLLDNQGNLTEDKIIIKDSLTSTKNQKKSIISKLIFDKYRQVGESSQYKRYSYNANAKSYLDYHFNNGLVYPKENYNNRGYLFDTSSIDILNAEQKYSKDLPEGAHCISTLHMGESQLPWSRRYALDYAESWTHAWDMSNFCMQQHHHELSLPGKLEGTFEDETLVGSNGSDKIYGKNGDDILVGGKGNDHLYGGNGYDKYKYNLGDGVDTIHDSQANIQFEDGLSLNDLDFEFYDSEVVITIKNTEEPGQIIYQPGSNDSNGLGFSFENSNKSYSFSPQRVNFGVAQTLKSFELPNGKNIYLNVWF
tara:strand:- start:2897 stop:4987 length:2091 start_codon:yes stop_codon:yes gene_type:complete